jgi:hypothetical protein
MTDIVHAPSAGRTERHTATWLSKLQAYIRLLRRRTHSGERLPAYLERDIGLDRLRRRLKDVPYY